VLLGTVVQAALRRLHRWPVVGVKRMPEATADKLRFEPMAVTTQYDALASRNWEAVKAAGSDSRL
jgi:hypothetical protein